MSDLKENISSGLEKANKIKEDVLNFFTPGAEA